MNALFLLLSLISASSAFAQDAAETEAELSPRPLEEPKKAKRMPQKKEADGTQAPNRFKEDPVIQSRYRAGGQPLEVDPD